MSLPKDFLYQIIKRKEVPLGNFLGYLLKPDESHQLPVTLLEVIWEQIIFDQLKGSFTEFDPDTIIESFVAKKFEVDLEDFVDDSGSGRIDILLHNGNQVPQEQRWAIIIELKVDHSFDNDISKYWYSVNWVEDKQKIGLVISPNGIFMNSERFRNVTFEQFLAALNKEQKYHGNMIIKCLEDYLKSVIELGHGDKSIREQYNQFASAYSLRRTRGSLKDKTPTDYFYGSRRNLNESYIRHSLNLTQIEKGKKTIEIFTTFAPSMETAQLNDVAKEVYDEIGFLDIEVELKGGLYTDLSSIYEDHFLEKETKFADKLWPHVLSRLPEILIPFCGDHTSVHTITDDKEWFIYKQGYREFLGLGLIVKSKYIVQLVFLVDERYKNFVNRKVKEDEYVYELIQGNNFFLVEGKYLGDYKSYDYQGTNSNITYEEVIEKSINLSSTSFKKIEQTSSVVTEIMEQIFRIIENFNENNLFDDLEQDSEEDADTIYARL